ncbi:MAG: family N-acetyltransferase [Solirubrobacterales bacterium]|nr:family N-acetyltransferase [Solirubrobacterales bacterium]
MTPAGAFSVRPIAFARTRPLRQGVLRPHQTVTQLADGEPTAENALAAGAFAPDGALVAVGFVHPDEDGKDGAWRVRGMATAPEARGRGAGGAVLDLLLHHATAHGATRVWCNARTPALSLYARAGFRPVSAEFDLPPMGPHVVMERPTP